MRALDYEPTILAATDFRVTELSSFRYYPQSASYLVEDFFHWRRVWSQEGSWRGRSTLVRTVGTN